MRTWRLFKQSMIALGRNKTRSFLVMLGVVVGISSLTVVVSMAKSANRKVMQRVNQLRSYGNHAVRRRG